MAPATTAPMAIAAGGPRRAESAPACVEPMGPVPIIPCAYRDITRPRRWSGVTSWMRVLAVARNSIWQKPTP